MPPKRAAKAQTPGFQGFLKDLKNGALGNIVLMYGPEQYLVRWAVSEVKKMYVQPATEMMDYVQLDGAVSAPADIIAAAETFSMLSEKRVVWVQDFIPVKSPNKVAGYGEDGIEQLLKYIETANDGTIVIFSNEEIDGARKLGKALKKYGKVYEFGMLSEREFTSFAMKRLQGAGLKIRQDDMKYLVNATGYYNKESVYRLHHFENDLKKLIAHASNGVITRRDIDLLIDGDNDTFIFDLIDGISGRNKAKAFEILYNKLHSGDNAVQICATLIGQVELMLYIREFLDSRDGPQSAASIAKYMKMNEFRVKKAMGYTRKYSLEKLREIVRTSYETYGNMIGGVMDPQLALELFIARM